MSLVFARRQRNTTAWALPNDGRPRVQKSGEFFDRIPQLLPGVCVNISSFVLSFIIQFLVVDLCLESPHRPM